MDLISFDVVEKYNLSAGVFEVDDQITFDIIQEPALEFDVVSEAESIIASVEIPPVIQPRLLFSTDIIQPQVFLPDVIQPEIIGTTGPRGDTGPAVPIYSYAVPAVPSFTISHMLGRRPVGPVFYDLTGAECDVGILNPDLNTIDVIQENLTEGVVTFL